MSVEVHTLGCRLNLAESERLRALIGGGGSDVVVINSCAVTHEAVRQTRQAIRRARRARPDARLLVTGCAAEVEREALRSMREVDGLVANADKLDPRAYQLPARSPSRPAHSARHTRAFVQVQNGCDHACTFCVIPQGRGPSRSRSVAQVVAEVSEHRAADVSEVVLTGVDLTSWGHDLPAAPRLGDLVAALLAAVPDLPRLRLSSIDGAEVDPLLFELMTGEPRVMPHVHLSLQSGDDMILKRMKRRHTRAQAIDLVRRLRARRPDIAIGADLIAGFPTEDGKMHAANASILAELVVVHGHVFPYSARPNTPAARMPQVAAPTIKARAAELRAIVAANRARWLGSLVGRPHSVLAERDGTGHTPQFAAVRLPECTAAGTVLTITPTRVVEGILE